MVFYHYFFMGSSIYVINNQIHVPLRQEFKTGSLGKHHADMVWTFSTPPFWPLRIGSQ